MPLFYSRIIVGGETSAVRSRSAPFQKFADLINADRHPIASLMLGPAFR